MDTSHKFTRSEIKQAEHEFAEMIENYFHEVWRIKSDGEYIGCWWDCRSMVSLDAGLWRLLQTVIHKGGTRAAGHIEVREAGHVLRFIVYYNPKHVAGPKLIQ